MPVVVLIGALLGLFTASTLTWLDAGELGAAAWELGIAHPPGFPVFAQVHALVMHLFPFGDAAFRGALASALVGTAALGFLFAVARELGCRPLAAAAVAYGVATSGIFLLHATTIEVYSGVACFLSAGLWLGLRLRHTGDRRFALALGLLVGLAAGHHAELRLFVLVLILAALRPLVRNRRAALFSLGFAVLGALCVLYLPLRSAAEPWRDWGNPETLLNLWDHLWGRSIRLAYADELGRLDLNHPLTMLFQYLAAHPLLLIGGVLGLLLGGRRPEVRLVLLIGLLDFVYAVLVNPMGLRDLQNGVPALCCLGLGLGLLIEDSFRGRRGRVVAAILLILLAFWPPAGSLHTRSDGAAQALLDAAADEAPPETLALVASDNLAAGFAFGQVVEGLRPDLAVVVRQHIGRGSSVGPVARRLPEALQGWHPGAALQDLRRLKDGWPLRWEWARGLDAEAAPAVLAPRFPWFAAEAGGDDGRFLPALDALLGRLEGLNDPQSHRALAALATDLGRWRQPHDARGAWQAFNVSVALEPGDAEVERELARQEIHLHEPNAAHQRLTALLEKNPDDAEALGLRGVVLANRGLLREAAQDWLRAIELDPDQAEAQVGLAQLANLKK